MQLGAVVVLAILAAPVASSSVSASSTEARLWLGSHGGAPSGDQLAALKIANPAAYAMVTALLSKRSLGLLDPKHPSATLSAPAPEQDEQAAAPDVEEAPQAAAAPRHDWLNWRPQKASTDDESQVQNMLAAVAELRGGAPPVKKVGLLSKRRIVQHDESAFANDEESLLAADGPAETSSAPAASKPAAATKAKGGWAIDFSSMLAGPKSLLSLLSRKILISRASI